MKNLLFYLMSFVFVLSSCSSDDDSGGIDSRILGTWRLTSLVYGGEEEHGENQENYFVYKNDGTAREYELDEVGEYSECEVDFAKFSFDGTTLKLNGNSIPIRFEDDKMYFEYLDGEVEVVETYVKDNEFNPDLEFIKEQDPSLIGVWELVEVDSEDISGDDCLENTTLTINSNGTYSYNGFELNESESCVADNDSGSWETYPSCNSLLIDSSFDNPESIEYYIDGNTLYIYSDDAERKFSRKLLM